MEIDKDTLPSMADFGQFQNIYCEYVKIAYGKALLEPIFSIYRLRDAYYAWRKDLERVAAREDNIEAELDHFKQSAHLSYWLRRCAPVIECENLSELYEEGGLYPDEEALQEFLYKYGTEYVPLILAFKFASIMRQSVPTGSSYSLKEI